MYPVSANWPPLRRDWCASAGTIWTVRAASRRLCLRRAMVVAGVGWLWARAKTLLDWSAVGMKVPPNFPVFEVHAVSHAAEGMDPLRASCLIRCLYSCRCRSERGGACVVHLYCVHVREFLSVWDGAREKDTFFGGCGR